MNELENFIQNVMFGRMIEDIDFIIAGELIKLRENGEMTCEHRLTEQFGSFCIIYIRQVSAVYDGADPEQCIDLKVRFCGLRIKTPSGISISQMDEFTRFYRTKNQVL